MIQSALEKIKLNRTLITIAHRLSTIQNADKVVVPEDGCIKQSGTHTELASTCGLYSALLKFEMPEVNAPPVNSETYSPIEDGTILDNEKTPLKDHIKNNNSNSGVTIINHKREKESEYKMN
ncbi:unnamed protein product [Trichobilharzia szidati]|nr:unnamed protein product [Trichobilharzia szidati]